MMSFGSYNWHIGLKFSWHRWGLFHLGLALPIFDHNNVTVWSSWTRCLQKHFCTHVIKELPHVIQLNFYPDCVTSTATMVLAGPISKIQKNDACHFISMPQAVVLWEVCEKQQNWWPLFKRHRHSTCCCALWSCGLWLAKHHNWSSLTSSSPFRTVACW